MKRLSLEEFIKKSKDVHGDKYDYINVVYKNSKDKVSIICRKHNYEFHISPNHHLRGSGCSKCSGNYNKTSEEFIKESIEKHGDKYDYSLTEYKNANDKIIIICPIHGKFEQKPQTHLSSGCKKCNTANIKGDYIEYFIKKCSKIHKNKYSYSDIKFTESGEMILLCKKHGEFIISHSEHLKGKSCIKCSKDRKNVKLRNRRSMFFKKCNIKHDNLYTYVEDTYLNSRSKISIICDVHGEFKQNAQSHLLGHGCSKCSGNYKDIDLFIKEANLKHNNKYNYTKTIYKNAHTKVIIICPTHGEFKQTPSAHLNYQGCNKCKQNKGESIVESYLILNNIKYNKQQKFDGCFNKNKLPFDFYLPDYNTCIEYDGIQHFKPVRRFGGIKSFEKVKTNDSIKNKYCLDNDIKLIRIPYYIDVYDELDKSFGLITEKNNIILSNYQKTVNNLKEEFGESESYKWSELISKIDHHYKSDTNANSTLRNYINKGIIKGFFLKKINNSLYLYKSP